ncbi:MAG: GNAT family N-acetyltransferase [Planctomycetaceae bacterium]
MPKPSEPKWAIEPFDRSRHDRSEFDCGVPVLNEWLTTKVSQFEKKDLARTYVLVESGDVVVKGYYALSNHTVIYDALPDDQAKGLPRIDVPVVLIGRLGVDLSTQGQGMGEFLLIDAVRRAEYLAEKIGIRAVEVDAINDAAQKFYQRYGFLSLKDAPQHLFLPMQVIRKLKLPPL